MRQPPQHSHAAMHHGTHGMDPRANERQRTHPDHSDLLAELDEAPSDEEDIIFKKGSTDEEQQQASKKDMTILIIIFALVVIALIAIIIWIMMRDSDKAAEIDVQQMMQRPPPMPPQRMPQHAGQHHTGPQHAGQQHVGQHHTGQTHTGQQHVGQPQGGNHQALNMQNHWPQSGIQHLQNQASRPQRPLTTSPNLKPTPQHAEPTEDDEQDNPEDEQHNEQDDDQPNELNGDEQKTHLVKDVPVVKLVGLFSNSTSSADDVLKQTRAALDPRYDEKDRELLNRKSRDDQVTFVISMEDQAENVNDRIEVIE
jgi:hypothetical protein